MEHTVLGVKISRRHDYTSYAPLGHFEVELRCGTRRYDTQAQCSVRRFIAGAAHFGARMLKTRPTGRVLFTGQIVTLSHLVARFSPPHST